MENPVKKVFFKTIQKHAKLYALLKQIHKKYGFHDSNNETYEVLTQNFNKVLEIGMELRELITEDLLFIYEFILSMIIALLGKDFTKYEINKNALTMSLVQFLMTGRILCICKNRICPCKEFMEKDICVCGVFRKKLKNKK